MKYVAPLVFTVGFGLTAFIGCSSDAEDLFGGGETGGEGGEGGEAGDGGNGAVGPGPSTNGPTTAGGNTTTTAAGTTAAGTTNGATTSGPSTSSATTGGGIIPGVGCNTNGQCTDQGDDCVCPDCDNNEYCSNPQNCTVDGVCDAFYEGCICIDCLTQHPECVDN